MDRYQAIDCVAAAFEGCGEAWSDTTSGDRLAVVAVNALIDRGGFGLTLQEVIDQNLLRRNRWHANMDPWSAADWGNAFGGEVGEVVEALVDALEMSQHAGAAQNMVKKLRRHETGAGGSYNTPQDTDAIRDKVAEEVADAVLYAILLCDHIGVDLERALIDKFNEVSEAQGFPERIGVNL